MENKSELIGKMYNIMYGKRNSNVEIKINTFLRDNNQFNPKYLLLMNKEKMQALSDKDCLILANAMSHFNYLKLDDYFTPAEIKTLRNYEIDDINDISDSQLMTFKNVFQLSQRQYCAVASVAQIAMLQERGLVVVDPNFQRQTKREKINNSILETVLVNKNRVAAIADSLFKEEQDGSYKFNAIRYNLMLDEAHLPQIKDGIMQLDPAHKLICIDGNHRQKAAMKAYFEADEVEKQKFENKYFVVLLSNLTVREVKDTISQEWNTEAVSRSAKANMKNSPENEIVELVRFSGQLEPLFANSIGTDGNDSRKFISVEYMSLAIKNIYGEVRLKSKQQVVADKIIEVFNYFTTIHEEQFVKQRFPSKFLWSQACGVVLVWLSNKDNWHTQIDYVLDSCELSTKFPKNCYGKDVNRYVKTIILYCEENFSNV